MSSERSPLWRRSLGRLLAEAKSIEKIFFAHDYPAWIRSAHLNPGDIPVFYYHNISTKRLERELRYLQRNSYSTVTADEYYECMTQLKRQHQRLVMITFDDGLIGLFDTVFPLLRQFNMKAVVYIVPDWIEKPGFITWDYITTMHRSGLVDFQSHSMSHRAIYIKPHIEDFFPGEFYTKSYHLLPLNLVNVGIPDFYRGMPIYTATSRLSDQPRFFPDGEVERFCFQSIGQHNQSKRLWTHNWKSHLLRALKQSGLPDRATGHYESAAEQREAIQAEIYHSRSTIEDRLVGKQVRHFAYPWHIGGRLSAEVLRNGGFWTCAGGLSDPPGVKAMASQLLPVRRVNLDFLRCLPGTGRLSFPGVWTIKIARRIVRSGGGQFY
jgi:hypothetical protein